MSVERASNSPRSSRSWIDGRARMTRPTDAGIERKRITRSAFETDALSGPMSCAAACAASVGKTAVEIAIPITPTGSIIMRNA